MQFANTIWLWGLAGLIIPIGIHLLSRKAGNVIRFGSVRHLSDTNTRQFKSIRLNEWVLLILRSLVITCLVFLISGLHIDAFEKKSKWLLVDKGLAGDQEFALLIDSLRNNGFEIRSLSPGFPLLGDSLITDQKTDYWSLLEKVEMEPLEQAIVLSNNYIEGFKGKRTTLPDHIQWLSKDPDSREYVANLFEQSEDSIAIRFGRSSRRKTSFYTRKIGSQDVNMTPGLDSVTVESPDTISVVVVYDPAFVYDKNILLAALEAVQKKTPVILSVETVPTDRYANRVRTAWVVWLSDKPFPTLDQNLIQVGLADYASEDLLIPTNNTHGTMKWRLTKRLNEEVALQDHLAVQLALILSATKDLDRIDELDRRTLPEELLWRKTPGDTIQVKASVDTNSGERLISIALLLILLAERLLAFKRDQ